MNSKPSRRTLVFAVLVAVGAALTSPAAAEPKTSELKIESSAFQNAHSIPQKYACDGTNVSPPLRWSGAPAGTKSFALACEDPDAAFRPWVHWVVYGLSNATNELPEHVPNTESLADGAKQGLNSFHRIGYGGPCPPGDKPHRYFFKLYALDAEPALNPLATKAELLHVIEGHVLAEAELMGTYSPR